MTDSNASQGGSSTKTLSLSSLLAKEARLLKEASRAMPHSFSTCTYDAPGGYIRQAVYLCKTCKGPDGEMGKGICAACSISCHADHEQLELFPKRAFRCDCPTTAVPVSCSLHERGKTEPPNEENVYGPNYQGKFCRCGRDYDPATETEIMAQCVACEDWYHESCLNIRGRVVARTPKSSPTKPRTSSPAPRSSEPPSSDYDYDDEEEEEEADEDLKLIPASGYESLICGSCVARIPPLQRWAGTTGVRMIIRRRQRREAETELLSSPTRPSAAVDFGGWQVLGENLEATADFTTQEGVAELSSQRKRSASPLPASSEEPALKKARLENDVQATKTTPCRAPPSNPLAQQVLSGLNDKRTAEDGISDDAADAQGQGDIFLSEGWRDRWCRCDECLPSLQAFPYLLEEEDPYVPPEDPDSKKSLEELGLRALQSLPRDKALDSIRAFNDMRDGLMEYLKPFAQAGKVVSEQDVTAFFEALKAGERPPPPPSTLTDQ